MSVKARCPQDVVRASRRPAAATLPASARAARVAPECQGQAQNVARPATTSLKGDRAAPRSRGGRTASGATRSPPRTRSAVPPVSSRNRRSNASAGPCGDGSPARAKASATACGPGASLPPRSVRSANPALFQPADDVEQGSTAPCPRPRASSATLTSDPSASRSSTRTITSMPRVRVHRSASPALRRPIDCSDCPDSGCGSCAGL